MLFYVQVFEALTVQQQQQPGQAPSVTGRKRRQRQSENDRPRQTNAKRAIGKHRIKHTLEATPVDNQQGESHLYSVIRVQKQVPATDATVDTAQGHEEAVGEEVAVVKVSHAVVQPGWDAGVKENRNVFGTQSTYLENKSAKKIRQ